MKQYRSLAVHNSACNEIFYKFQDCENEHKFGRFIGYCRDLHRELDSCIREQRKIHREENYRASKERKAKISASNKQENEI